MAGNNRETLLSWIGLISTEQDYDEAKRERQPGTCAWIFRTAEFQAFHTGASTSNLLWIHGGPGTGKTFLSASIVEFLKQRSSLPVAYFFCKNEDVDKKNAVSILRSWIYQLASQRIEALDVIESFNRGAGVATEGNLWDLFPTIVHRLRCCYLVVDGIDELADYHSGARHRRTGVVELFLKRLFDSMNGSTTKVVVVSRDEPTIRAGLEENCEDLQEYAISPDDTAEDIGVFARATISSIGIQDSAIEGQFINQLSDSCQGMFLWVRLEGERLEKGMDSRELRGILSSMPRGLGHSYERNLRRILGLDQQMQNQARNILRWILFATRPLSVVELFHLLAASENSTSMANEIPVPITDYHIRRKILKLCGSIVEVQGGVEPADRTIHFLHFSAKEFLLSRQNQIDHPDLAEFFYPTPELDHGILASSCLSLLLTDSEPEPVSKAIDYPRGQWMDHLQLSSESYASSCLKLQERLFQPGLPFDRWIKSRIMDYYLTPVGVACWFGLSDLFMVLSTKRSSDLENLGCPYGNALHLATLTGNIAFVQHLLSTSDLSVNSTNSHGWTSLHIASSNGYLAIIEYLLTRPKIDVNATGDRGETPLLGAVSMGQVRVVELLLARSEIDINRENCYGLTPLSVAIERDPHMREWFMLRSQSYANPTGSDSLYAFYHTNNCLKVPVAKGVIPIRGLPIATHCRDETFERALNEIVERLLIRTDICLNHRGRAGRTPLFIAAGRGNEPIVRHILSRADHTRDSAAKELGTPRVKAALQGVFSSLKRHFRRSTRDAMPNQSISGSTASGVYERTTAAINIADHYGRTPLYAAASAGHMAVVEHLLTYADIDVNAASDSSLSPLHSAVVCGYTAVVEQLLARQDTDVNLPSKDRCTPLLAAARGGHVAVLERLISLPQIDVNAADEKGWSPLLAAASSGYTTIVERLIALPNIDVNAADNEGWSPLHAAVQGGHAAVVQQLLSRQDVDINACRNGSPPIYTALYRNRKAVAVILLRSPKIIVRHINSYGQSLLHTAALHGCEEAVSILVVRDDIDVNCQSNGGRTPLFSAARGDEGAVVDVLLASKAVDINCPDDEGCTPICIAARRGNDSIVESLLSQEGIDVLKADNTGITLLHIAAFRGSRDLAERLIYTYNVDINAVTVEGRTPLFYAACQQQGDTVRMLLAAPNIRLDWPGADVPETGGRGVFTKEDQHNAARFLAQLQSEMNAESTQID